MGNEFKIHLTFLYRELGFTGGKIPADYERGFAPMDVPMYPSYNPRRGMTLELMIVKAPKVVRKSSAHRIFVKCPKCGKTVPAGRLHQHVGTGTCN